MPTSLTTQDGQLLTTQDGEVLLAQPGNLVAGSSTALPNPAAVLSCPLACADGLYRPRYPFGTAATPTFAPVAGTYTGTQTVSINCPTPKATIYYTLDGSTPTTASTVFTQPITVSATETIKAIATAPSFQPGAVGTATYTISTGPALSLVGPFTLAAAAQGALYQQTITATGGTTPYVFSLNGSASGTNAWSVSAAGVISGTPANVETDSIPVKVTDALNAIATASYSVTVGGISPTLVQLLLQGQTAQGKGSNVGGINGIQPQNPNYTMIGWLGVAGATQYNIYRATIPVGSQATGVLNYGASPYATISAAAAASAYTGYVNGSGTYPYQTAVNCAYGDSAATLCQNPTRGGGTGTTGPTVSPGDLWAATGYSYKVSAVVNGIEGPLSDPHYGVFISNGLRILNGGAFNNMPATNATDGGVTPTGNTLTTKWMGGPSPYWNPYVDAGATQWMLNLRQWNYFQFYIKAGQAGDPGLSTAFEQEGDLTLDVGISGGQAKGPTFNRYATLVNGQYVLVKMPLADLATDIVRGRQNTFYKFGSFGGTNGSTGTWWMDDMKFVT